MTSIGPSSNTPAASTDSIVHAVRDALDGGPTFTPQPRLSAAEAPPGTALVLRTSGSTGNPREVALSAAALRSSAQATHERLGGPGHWLLVLPPTHVAGIQVITRSIIANTEIRTGEVERFTPEGFAALTADFLTDGARAYVSLVPTQLHRLVTAADGGKIAGLNALARFNAVLVGGAATPPGLLAHARAAGVRAVTTYGMSETSGGCVYDGAPLSGVRMQVRRDTGNTGTGLIELSGPMLAEGYIGDDAATSAAFRTDSDGIRWFRTSDHGHLEGDHLTVLGRSDDVILTGGVNVSPSAVESVAMEHLTHLGTPGEACVIGVSDDEWGQVVVVILAIPGHAPAMGDALADGSEHLAGLRSTIKQRLGAAAAPRRVYLTATLPTCGPGKIDRRAVHHAVLQAEREPMRP